MNTPYRIVGSLAVLGLIATGSMVAGSYQLFKDEYNIADTEYNQVASTVQNSINNIRDTQKIYDETFAEVTEKQGLVDARKLFLEAVAGFVSTFETTENKVDNVGERENVLTAQETVLEATTVTEIEKATKIVTTQTGILTEKVKQHDAEQAHKAAEENRNVQSNNTETNSPGNSNNNSGNSSNWFNELRTILNNAGGGHINLVEFDGTCGGVWAKACAVPGTIMVNSQLAGESYNRKVWSMTHELAHQYQFNKWDSIMGSSDYHNLFGGNIEYLANCMTAVRGVNASSHSCNQAQINYASTLW